MPTSGAKQVADRAVVADDAAVRLIMPDNRGDDRKRLDVVAPIGSRGGFTTGEDAPVKIASEGIDTLTDDDRADAADWLPRQTARQAGM